MATKQESNRLRIILHWAGVLLLITSAIYFLAAFSEHADVLYRFEWTPHRLLQIAGLVGGQLILIGLTTSIWLLLLRAYDIVTPARCIFIIRLLSQFAKYLPGNVAHHFARLGLAKIYHMDLKKTGLSMGLEIILLLFSILTIAYVSLIFGNWETVPMPSRGLSLSVGIIAIICIFLTILFNQRSKLIQKLVKLLPNKWMLVMIQGYMVYLVTVILMGAMLWFILHYILMEEEAQLIVVIGAFGIAWFAGFAAPGAPAGLGVREAILLLLLGPLVGEASAISAALLQRAVMITGDGLSFCFGLYLRHYMRGDT